MLVMYSFSFIYIFSFEGGLTSKVNTIFCDRTFFLSVCVLHNKDNIFCTVVLNSHPVLTVFVPLCNEIIHTLRSESLALAQNLGHAFQCPCLYRTCLPYR